MEQRRARYGPWRQNRPEWLQHEGAPNITLLEAFEWHVPQDQQHWRRLRAVLGDLQRIGINHLWLPPGCKASGPASNGYDVYDLYDLGEFDWKGCRATKWGPKEDLAALAESASERHIGLIWDAVLNHKAAADSKETVGAVKVDPADRNKAVSPLTEIEAWVGFEFPGRQGKHSSLAYHKEHFSGVDYDARTKSNAIFRFKGKQWATDVDTENGNSDYLMFSNLDYSNSEVRQDVTNWGCWISGQVPLTGMRLDAIRHIPESFVQKFISSTRTQEGARFIFIGEYWKASLPALRSYLSRQLHSLCLYDVPLVYSLAKTSRSRNPDLRRVFANTLVFAEPNFAVTCVTNHDSQLGQDLSPSATVERSFLPSAYAMILLRDAGVPCIFYGDLYGTCGPHAKGPIQELPILCAARARYAFGRQRDYFDDRYCIGWTREGSEKFNQGAGVAVVVNWQASRPSRSQTTSQSAFKTMLVGKWHAGEVWKDVLGHVKDPVRIDKDGFGSFKPASNSVTVWVNALAPGLDELYSFDSQIYQREL